jgi:hypothetical protein
MDLPKRPEQHVTAERAVGAVINALPRTWIKREQQADYGIDLEVEIANEVVSGRIFKGQVKGRQSVRWTGANTISVSVRAETLSYWNQFPVPVILFLVDLATRSIGPHRLSASHL